MTEKMFFLLTDFVSHKVRIIVVVIRKWAADNGKRLVRTNWKIGLFSEKKVRTEKQKKEGVLCILGMLKTDILFILFYVIKTYSGESL